MSALSDLLDECYIQYNAEHTGWQSTRCPNPTHDDRHASCRVNLEVQAVKCQGCDLSGNIYNVLILVKGITYQEAKALVEKGDSEKYSPPGTIERKEVPPNGGWKPRYRRTSPAQRARRRG